MKDLYKQPYFDHRNFILSRLGELKISNSEALLLLLIDFENEFGNIITYESLALKLNHTPDEISDLIDGLIAKGFLEIKIKDREILYSIDSLFKLDYENKVIDKNVFQDLFQLYEDAFGRPLNRSESERLSEWMSEYDLKLIEYALKEAIVYEKRNFDYINAILAKWKQRGLTSDEYENGER